MGVLSKVSGVLLSSEPGGNGTVKEKRYPRRWRSGTQGMEIFGCGARAR